MKIYKKKIFPDHYEFSKAEIQKILEEAESKNYQIITTEKDFFKINKYGLKKINYLKTENLDEANCYVLNTCHIREKATDKVYHDIGRVKKQFRKKIKLLLDLNQ